MFGAEDDGMQFQPDGYLLMFHPDLLRNTPLGRIMREYSFFSYETNEALHLSVEERQIIMDCFHKIQYELNHPIHRHSKNLITDSIKTFLDYCTRSMTVSSSHATTKTETSSQDLSGCLTNTSMMGLLNG